MVEGVAVDWATEVAATEVAATVKAGEEMEKVGVERATEAAAMAVAEEGAAATEVAEQEEEEETEAAVTAVAAKATEAVQATEAAADRSLCRTQPPSNTPPHLLTSFDALQPTHVFSDARVTWDAVLSVTKRVVHPMQAF